MTKEMDGPDVAESLVESVVSAVGSRNPATAWLLLHPYVHWTEHGVTIKGRTKVLALLADRSRQAAPVRVELRDGQIYRWVGDD